jgi:hypothetical protein
MKKTIGSGIPCPCGTNRTSDEGSDNSIDCICEDGSYGDDGANKQCSICEAGEFCHDGYSSPCPDSSYCPTGTLLHYHHLLLIVQCHLTGGHVLM